MKYKLPLLLLSGLTGVVLSGLFEISANAVVVEKTTKSQTTQISPNKIGIPTTYSLPQHSELKLESPKETLVISKLRQSTQIPEELKVIGTQKLQTLLADSLNDAPQSSVAQNVHTETIETETSLIMAESHKTGNDIPTIADAQLPPRATAHNSAILLEQTEARNQSDPATLAQTSEEEQFPPAEEVVPERVDPGRPTRSGSSYIGVGANFGVGGDTSLGDSGLFLYSKIGLTRYFSVRPAVNTDFEEDATFLLPLTFDLAPLKVGDTGVSFAPYFGGGPAVSTTGDFGPVISGGVDLPLTKDLTVTSGVNIGILDEVDVGVFVGIGYNFSGF